MKGSQETLKVLQNLRYKLMTILRDVRRLETSTDTQTHQGVTKSSKEPKRDRKASEGSQETLKVLLEFNRYNLVYISRYLEQL